jgi:hypothetical protein
LYLLLFEVSDYKRKAMKRTIAEQYICMEWPPPVERNDQMDEEFLYYVVWKWRIVTRELLTIIGWGEISIASEHHCFDQVLIG